MSTSYAYQKQTAEFIARFIQSLPEMSPDVMQEWIERPKILRRVLSEALSEPRFLPLPDFQTWKTVVVGTIGNAETARKQLDAAGVRIDGWGDYVLGQIPFEETEATLDLVQVSGEELGRSGSEHLCGIYSAARHNDLSLCPPEVALQLCLQYPDLLLPPDEGLYVAMEPIPDSSGYPNVLHLDRDDHMCISGQEGDRNEVVHTKDRWVFVRSKLKHSTI